MTAQRRADELAELRAEVAALRARVERPRRRFPRRVLPLAIVGAAGGAHATLDPRGRAGLQRPRHRRPGPSAEYPGDRRRGDHHRLRGPANPGQRLYNPKANVTREEMASFLARTAGLGGNPPVANALTAANANHAASADNATTVGGYAPGGLVRVAHATGTNIGNFTTACFTYSTLAQASLTAPTAGYLLVNGAAVTANQGGNGRRDFFLRTRIGVDASPASTAVADLSQATAATTWVFPVSAGAQTIVLEGCGNPFSGSQTISVASPQLTVLFVPFGSTGTSAP